MAMWPNPQHYRPHDSIPGPEADRDERENWDAPHVAYIPEPDAPECVTCGGHEVIPMGRIGRLWAWHCRACGWKWAE